MDQLLLLLLSQFLTALADSFQTQPSRFWISEQIDSRLYPGVESCNPI